MHLYNSGLTDLKARYYAFIEKLQKISLSNRAKINTRNNWINLSGGNGVINGLCSISDYITTTVNFII